MSIEHPRATSAVVEVRVQLPPAEFAALEARAARARLSIGSFLRGHLATALEEYDRDKPNPDGP
jgi:hypothetical protein